jgi:hypothetical protein
LRRAAYDIAVIADIADIARDRKGKGKNLPRINTDERGSGIGDREKQKLRRMKMDSANQETIPGVEWCKLF